MSKTGARLLDNLPAIYLASDSSGHLQRLLGIFEETLFHSDDKNLTGIEQQIEAIPSLFSPLDNDSPVPFTTEKSPDRFLPWLATWVAFTPQALFAPEKLRDIISCIAPLYGRRGTRTYLEQLLKICFDEISTVTIVDEPAQGLKIGQARIGEDTQLGGERPFWFRVTVDIGQLDSGSKITESHREFEQRVRAIIDFAKPGHTTYDLRLRISSPDETGMYPV